MFGIINKSDPINRLDTDLTEQLGSSWIVEVVQVNSCQNMYLCALSFQLVLFL